MGIVCPLLWKGWTRWALLDLYCLAEQCQALLGRLAAALEWTDHCQRQQQVVPQIVVKCATGELDAETLALSVPARLALGPPQS